MFSVSLLLLCQQTAIYLNVLLLLTIIIIRSSLSHVAFILIMGE